MTTTVIGQLPFCTHRYAIFVSYIGTKFNGSQRLTGRGSTTTQATVQESLEWSLENFVPKKSAVLTSASRTDRGVHALTNCFSLPVYNHQMPTDRFKRLLVENLTHNCQDILVRDVFLMSTEFHPRRMAKSREYIFRLAVLHESKSAGFGNRHRPQYMFQWLPITELYRTLPVPRFDLVKAQEAVDTFRGTHDFRAFAHQSLEVEDTVRELEISLKHTGQIQDVNSNRVIPFDSYELHFKSRSFLHNQIRRIVGAILAYASYDGTSIDTIKEMLKIARPDEWKHNMVVSEPWGLYLSRINYAEQAFEGAIETFEDGTEKSVFDSNAVQNYIDESETNDCLENEENDADQKIV